MLHCFCFVKGCHFNSLLQEMEDKATVSLQRQLARWSLQSPVWSWTILVRIFTDLSSDVTDVCSWYDVHPGGKMVLFRNLTLQSITSESFLKKTLKLSNKDIIGSGGYGTVYKLVINDSMAFAVKRLNKGISDGDRGFKRELEAMGDIKHRNIVTLHGYCTACHYNLLIYELTPNGSLDTILHSKNCNLYTLYCKIIPGRSGRSLFDFRKVRGYSYHSFSCSWSK